jgi:D-alanine-D-alanine ligase
MTRRLRVGVIFGGRSGEHEISLRSARSVLAHLNVDRYEVTPIGITRQGEWFAGPLALETLERGRTTGLQKVILPASPADAGLYRWTPANSPEVLEAIDVAFPMLHGTFGEDGSIQGLLELAELPYVGAGVLASAVAMDKALFKSLMRAHGLPVVEWAVFAAGDVRDKPESVLDAAEKVGAYPLFVKPANLGSSVGISKVRSRSDLVEGLMDAARYDRRVMVERGIEAREIEVSVLGNDSPRASVPGEVIPSDDFYSYRAKYLDDRSQLVIPAPLDAQQAEDAQRMALESYRAIDGAGMARVDFLLERPTGRLYLSEINTIPGFTSISMYPKLWEASGIGYEQLMDELIDLAMERHMTKKSLLRQYEGAS